MADEIIGMKREELQKCRVCGKGMMHNNDIQFYRIKLESFIIDQKAIQEISGLEMMLGSSQLAQVMGTDPNIANRIFDTVPVLVCSPCVLDGATIVTLMD